MDTLKSQKSLVLTFLLALLVALTGCRQQTARPYLTTEKEITWPETPLQPRIRYVGQLTSEEDLGRAIKFNQALGNLFLGRKDIGVLARPYGVIVDNDNTLYIADSSGSVIHMMNLTSRDYLQFSAMGDERLISPIGLILADDNIYVADSILAKICVFDKKGEFQFSFGTDQLDRPTGIAYSSARQLVYVADTKRKTISLFTLDGTFKGLLTDPFGGVKQYNSPTLLWIDQNDQLYISDTLNYKVHVVSPEGKTIRTIGQHCDRPGCFAHPSGVATDSHGNIYVTDRQFENVQIFNPQGQILMAFGQEGNAEGQFWLPAGICINENNRIYIADSFNKRIQIFQLIESEENEK